jgi:hypothetical protein
MSSAAVERKYLSLSRIAAEHDCTVDAVRWWVTTGVLVGGQRVRLRAVRVGRSWRVPVEAWDEFMAGCNPEAPPRQESESTAARRTRAASERLRARLAAGRAGWEG